MPSRQRKYGGGKFQSEQQREYLWANCPRAARKWAHNRKTRPSDWRGCRIQTRPGRGMVSDGSIGGTMAKLTIEVEDGKLTSLMEALMDSGLIEGAEVEEAEDEMVASVQPDEAAEAVVAAIGAKDWKPAPEFFNDPQLEELQRWTTVTAEGRVYGHVAGWGECHIGISDQCITPEMISQGGFDAANNIGHVLTSDGEKIGTGPLAIKGGHADTGWDYRKASKHYDDPSTVVADVVYGTDDHGIWFSGSLRPSATAEQVYTLRASGVSGDWRQINGQLRFLASCCVNVPGYPKTDARVASGEVVAVVAAGGAPKPDPELEDCGCDKTLEERMDRLEQMLEPTLLAALSERLNGEKPKELVEG